MVELTNASAIETPMVAPINVPPGPAKEPIIPPTIPPATSAPAFTPPNLSSLLNALNKAGIAAAAIP